MHEETRRLAARRTIGRAETMGVALDPDPAFETIVEWVIGEIDMKQARALYSDHIREREQLLRDWKQLSAQHGFSTHERKTQAAASLEGQAQVTINNAPKAAE